MLIQKFRPAIRLGQQPTLVESGHPLFSRQGHWDGGSTLHCVSMALALLGKLAHPVYLPYHAGGTEQVVWDHAWPHYLHGLTLSELASLIAELNLGVQPTICSEQANDLLHFSMRELNAGRPVIIGWRQRHPVKWHAALAVGIEGCQSGRTFEPHALLLLDPAGDARAWRVSMPASSGTATIRSATDRPLPTRAVTVEGALSIRLLVSATASV